MYYQLIHFNIESQLIMLKLIRDICIIWVRKCKNNMNKLRKKEIN